MSNSFYNCALIKYHLFYGSVQIKEKERNKRKHIWIDEHECEN